MNEASNRPWALVTGASAGIGETFCRQLAEKGYRLVLVARRRERMEALARELESTYGVESTIIAADLSDPGTPDQIAATLASLGIEVEFLVNNAGYGVPGKFEAVDWDTHEAFLQVMVTAVCKLTWLLVPGMKSRGRGFIVNVASVAGLVPSTAGHTLYGASKSFLIRFSEALSAECLPEGVHVTALCPGFTYSEFHDVTGTRDQVSQLPGWMWLQADDVVSDGISGVMKPRPKTAIIPGRMYRLIVWLNGAVPRLGAWLANRSAHRYRKV